MYEVAACMFSTRQGKLKMDMDCFIYTVCWLRCRQEMPRRDSTRPPGRYSVVNQSPSVIFQNLLHTLCKRHRKRLSSIFLWEGQPTSLISQTRAWIREPRQANTPTTWTSSESPRPSLSSQKSPILESNINSNYEHRRSHGLDRKAARAVRCGHLICDVGFGFNLRR